jgi:hypothetical protein
MGQGQTYGTVYRRNQERKINVWRLNGVRGTMDRGRCAKYSKGNWNIN